MNHPLFAWAVLNGAAERRPQQGRTQCEQCEEGERVPFTGSHLRLLPSGQVEHVRQNHLTFPIRRLLNRTEMRRLFLSTHSQESPSGDAGAVEVNAS